MEKLKVQRIAQHAVINVESEKLDSLLAPHVKANIIHLLSEGVQNIVLNLESVRYCDSSGLGAILLGNRNCQSTGGKFIICNLSEPVQHLIGVSKLENTIHIQNSVQDSLEKFFL
jgi:anti-anti-sigma factor